MKRLWVAIGISIIIFSICIWGHNSVVMACDDMNECVSKITYHAENDNYQEAIISSQLLCDKWDKKQSTLSALLNHQEIHDLMITIQNISLFAQSNEKDELLTSCKEAETRLNHIKESEQINLGNIF